MKTWVVFPLRLTSLDLVMSAIPLSTESHTHIESTLGRKLAEDELGSVGSFDDFSEVDREELRIVAARSSIPAIQFIRYKLSGRTSLQDAVSYYDDVLRQGISHEKWIADRAAKGGQT
jgi:hypothetical protein